MKILIRKNPDKYEHLPYDKIDFQSIIDDVNLSDILDYILSTINHKWAPIAYWKYSSMNDKIYRGELMWLICSYLVHNKILIIEDRYFGYSPSRTEKYLNRLGYYNPLETHLYFPISNRMVNEKYLSDIDGGYYKLGPVYWRNSNLQNILND